MGPNPFQWCPATGQGATGTNWSRGSSIWTWGRNSSLWGWWSPGTGCPGRLWSLLLWRYSRPAWMRSCAAYCRRPCFGRGVGGPFQPPTFCEFVLLFGCFLAVGDRFYCHPFLSDAKYCSDFERRVNYVPLSQYHSQEKMHCKPLLRCKKMHLFRKAEDVKAS